MKTEGTNKKLRRESNFTGDCAMIRSLYAKSKELYRPSKFWEWFNAKNTKQLKDEGYEHFKQTANANYFQFMVEGVRNRYFTYFLQDYPKRELFKMFFFSKTKNCPLGFLGQMVYRTYVAMLYGYIKTIDRLNLVDRIHEPREGTPVDVFYEGKVLSQDILNSLQEFYAIEEVARISDRNSLVMGEVGAGYGRVGFLFANIFQKKKFKYCVFDIPPRALCIPVLPVEGFSGRQGV